jgi:hypothetical protein
MTDQKKLNAVRDVYKFFRQQQPSSPAWFQVVDSCIDILMQSHIADLESRAPMVGHEDD